MSEPRSDTETIILALRILANDIQSGDGVANATCAEAADRLEEYHAALMKIRDTKYCDYSVNYGRQGCGDYGTGVTDGHRVAADWAREAIDGK